MKPNFKITLASLCALSSAAAACSCMTPPAPKIALEQSAAVFVGRVVKAEKGERSNTFEFAVSKKWKGIEGNSASVVSATNSAACGIDFESGRDYLVYANKAPKGEQLFTNLCTRTARVADASADLAELGAPQTDGAPVSTAYPVVNGEVQINVKTADDPLLVLADAVKNDATNSKFRVNWSSPMNQSFRGTALYDRADSTLKAYSRAQNEREISVSSLLYSGVNDEVIAQLGASDKMETFFRDYAKYGVTQQDVGSKTVRVRRAVNAM